MILPYAVRLCCLSLACFFLVHLASGVVAAALASPAIRLARRMPAGSAARFLLAVRLSPSALSLFAVAALCVPSYLWLEPDGGGESVGPLCLIAAIAGITLAGVAVAGGLRAAVRSRFYVRYCRRAGRATQLPPLLLPVSVVDSAVPPVMLCGILRPRLIVSPAVIRELPADQLAAALRHEQAHWLMRDNLKRLLILLCPALPAGRGALRELERHWATFAEWAADDMAVAGNPEHALSLAEALVRVQRMCVLRSPELPATPLVTGGCDLAARVDRLLEAPAAAEKPMLRWAGAVLLLLVLAALQPATVGRTHELLEHLVH